ncbi:protein scarlet [Anopheles arabiensis]|uniref:ABC transporter domain-containing protein n=1 Tax=Anopheles arabiensis TaxID=7173 RepID=A0A182HGL8_ANOAR|nr:protein scarlet [Anopheles arabiensis]
MTKQSAIKLLNMVANGRKRHSSINEQQQLVPLEPPPGSCLSSPTPPPPPAGSGTGRCYQSSLRSYSKWSPTEQGATLVWRDLCVYATAGPAKGGGCGGGGGPPGCHRPTIKRIINNVSGAVTPGTLIALMGSSGAGKSTLMSALAYRTPPGTVVQGDILVNGQPVGPYMYRLSGFVHQDDLFVGSLTVHEHMYFMAKLRLDRRVGHRAIDQTIRDLLERVGLARCAGTRIGEAGDGKMLSGGEKKRLAFATELLTKPTLLFCDEPTTGLDSYGAQALVSTLQQLARRGTAIICTIHQPSSQLFSMFDQVMLLAEGRVAYAGRPHEALAFFARHGHACPPSYNPAEYLIGALATAPGYEQASQRAAHRLCDLFAVSEAAGQRDVLINLEVHMAESGDYRVTDEVQHLAGRPHWLHTTAWLTYRALLTVVRDPTVQYLRLLQKIAIALMAGLCFTGAIEPTQLGVQATQGLLFILISENTFTPMYAVLAVFPETFPLFMRETKNGLYHPSQYYVANVAAMLPGLVLEPLVFVLIAYWLAALRPTLYAFLVTAAAATLVMNVSTACGCFFSAAFNSLPLAMAYLVPFDYILMITSGVFIHLNTMPAATRWLPYISWMMYANEAMSIAQWEGVSNITCPAVDDKLPCLRTGGEVLEHYSFSETHLAPNLWAMVLLYFGFHLLGYLFLWRKTKR